MNPDSYNERGMILQFLKTKMAYKKEKKKLENL